VTDSVVRGADLVLPLYDEQTRLGANMGIGSFLGKLFGGSGNSESSDQGVAADPIEHEGFVIVAKPIKEGGQYRTAGKISKEIGGEEKSAMFVRADNHSDRQAAIDHAIQKGKQIIREQGDKLFDRTNV